jgi:hypothetical protein
VSVAVAEPVYEAQVAEALDAVALRAPGAFLWFGRRESADAGAEELVARIAQRLHDDFFSTGAPRPRRGGPATAPDDGGEFVRALSQANGGRGAWQDGWRIAAVEADEALLVVRADGLALVAPAAEVRAEGDAIAGATAAVLQPKELRGLSPGFYIALGDAGRPTEDARVGLFWNVTAAGAVTLAPRLTYALNGAGLPFALELLDTPARYGRGDAAVLCVGRADFAAAFGLSKPLLRTLGGQLSTGAPAFTRPLARGLAVAELPAAGQRFGEHRCRLLAEAVVAAGAGTAAQRLAAVRERFAAAGLSLDRPYLQPGSVYAYDRS